MFPWAGNCPVSPTCRPRVQTALRSQRTAGLLVSLTSATPNVEHVGARIPLPRCHRRAENFARFHGQGLVPFRSCSTVRANSAAQPAPHWKPLAFPETERARVVYFCAPARVKRRFYVHRAKGFFSPSGKFLPFAVKTGPMHAFSNRAGAWRRKCQKLPWRIKYPFAEHTLNANAREIFRAIRAGEVFAKGCFECR